MQTHPIRLNLAINPNDKAEFVGVIEQNEVDDDIILLFSGSDPLEIWSALQDVGAALNAKVKIAPGAKPACEAALRDFMEAIK